MKSARLVILIALVLMLVGTQAAWAAPAKSPAAESSCGDCYYKVKKGDTLLRIASRYRTTVRSLMRCNRIRNPNLIRRGSTLRVPCQKQQPDARQGCRKVHRVRYGENLYRISLRYCSTVAAIANRNHIRNPNLIYAGQKLCIPPKPYWCR